MSCLQRPWWAVGQVALLHGCPGCSSVAPVGLSMGQDLHFEETPSSFEETWYLLSARVSGAMNFSRTSFFLAPKNSGVCLDAGCGMEVRTERDGEGFISLWEWLQDATIKFQ